MSNTANPFLQMASTLANQARKAWPCVAIAEERQQPQTTRTDQIRRLLRTNGPLTAQNIAVQLDLERVSLVGALLKADLQVGRVRRIGPLYDWNHGHDEAQARELAAAARLLRRHGFTVRRSA